MAKADTVCWMSHNDYIEAPAPGLPFRSAYRKLPVAAAEDAARGAAIWCSSTRRCCTRSRDARMLSNFVYNVCGCKGTWKMDSFVDDTVAALRARVGGGRVLCALSGGVDSSRGCRAAGARRGQAAYLRVCRPRPASQGQGRRGGRRCSARTARTTSISSRVNAQQRAFYGRLAGVEEPEQKRKIIGKGEFIRVFEEVARRIGAVDYLVQGTIYPDVGVESGLGGESAVIKATTTWAACRTAWISKDYRALARFVQGQVRQAGRELGISGGSSRAAVPPGRGWPSASLGQ